MSDYIVDGTICMSEEDIKDLRKIFPDIPLDELYAIHYIHSRVGLCSWMCIPKETNLYGKEDIEQYKEEYLKYIKPYLTQEIIDAINHCGYVGSDSVEYKGKGYNLDKIFGYISGCGYELRIKIDKPETYTVEEMQLNPEDTRKVITSFITQSYTESCLPYLCESTNKSNK